MPIYEYKCEICGNVSEYLSGTENDEPIKCRQCGSFKMNRILSVSSFNVHSRKGTSGKTCCGREQRCDTPPCSSGGVCPRESNR